MNCLLLEHCVNMVEDLVIEFVRTVVADFKKLLLGHLFPLPKPLVLFVLAVIIVFVNMLFMVAFIFEGCMFLGGWALWWLLFSALLVATLFLFKALALLWF